MEARRAEQEAKQAKLEEFRRRREERRLGGRSATPAAAPVELTTVVSVLATRPKPVKYSKGTQTVKREELGEPVPETADTPAPETPDVPNVPADTPAPETPVQETPAPETTKLAPEFTIRNSNSPAIQSLVSHAITVFERALGLPDIAVDYAAPTTLDKPSDSVQPLLEFRGTHSVCSLDFSPHHPNLFVSAHSQANSVTSAGTSTALVWSMDFTQGPEYTLTAPTEILHVLFSRLHPWLVFGAGYNGQLMAWDLRAAGRTHAPSTRSPTDGTGHLMPICGLFDLPSVNHDVLFACSFDGVATTWPADRLQRPDSKFTFANKAPLAVSSVAVCPTDSNLVLVGTLPGPIYSAFRSDTVASKAGLGGVVYTGHSALVTAIRFHPSAKLFVSCGLDWSVRLWRVGEPAPLLELDRVDAVTDVAWNPAHVAVFACACQTTLEVWNLASSREEPVAQYEAADLVSKLCWDPRQPTRLLAGTMGGLVQELAVSSELLQGDLDYLL